jgi:hypothetical protein
MRLPGIFSRRREPGAVAEPARRAVPWAQVALPPPLTDATAPPPSESITTAPRPAVAKARPSVHLGFSDGTSHALPDSSDASEELVRLAARLIDEPRR